MWPTRGAATLVNSTVSGNSAKFGGGIAGPATLTATILAGNSAPIGADCQSAVATDTSGGYNLIGDATGCTFGGATAHDITGQDPHLGPLQDNGGPTATQAPAMGSPAIGAIPVVSGLCPAVDQRGDIPAPGAPTCDIGAVQTGYRLPATVTIDPASLTQTYDGAAKAARASVSPSSCGPVTLSYSQNGNPVGAPTAAGSYAVQASLGNSSCAIASGGTGTLVIAPAPATVTLGALQQTYDGAPKAASVTTSPMGLSVTVTYNGASAAPTNAGSYAVVATVSDPNYQGSASGTLTIAPATQAISFASTPPSPARIGATYTVAATGGASGNPITFAAGPSSVCTAGGINGTTITLVGVGTCTVTANQAGDDNYSAATPVQQSFTVVSPPLTLTLGVTSSPAGPVTTGSVVTVTGTLSNHTTSAETVTLTATFTYVSPSGHRYTISGSSRAFTLAAGQTLGQPFSFTISKHVPRGSYTVALTATDTTGDTASGSAALTIV